MLAPARQLAPILLALAAIAGGLCLGSLGPACSDGSHPGSDPCEGRACGVFEGKDCGTCPSATERCTVEGQCEDLCEGRECGPAPEDPGLSCGTCAGLTVRCTDEGQCKDLCEGRECGEPAGGISCGQCTAPELCGLAGRCFLPGGCPPGTVEVGLTGVCMDAFEKTVAEMAEFLTANGPVCRPDWAYDPNERYPCGGTYIFVDDVAIEQLPSGQYVPVERFEDYPVAWVSFAGAWMACQYFGGRLCTTEEWARACEGPEQHTYCYGDTYDATACNACNDAESPEVCPHELRLPEPVGSRPTCTGGYPGLYDMSGNVREWGVSSTLEMSPDANVTLGGFAEASSTDSVCRLSPPFSTPAPYQLDAWIGFRCCYTLY